MTEPFSFATTWWGEAWVEALEHAARLDPDRLSRGRSYARKGAVTQLELAPGVIRARVSGSGGRFYRVEVTVRRLSPSDWEQIADLMAGRAVHSAALAAGMIEPSLAEEAAASGVTLLPGAGDLRPHCTCPNWAEPCQHAAAVCYLAAGELDRDPLLLFRLRGITESELTDLLRLRKRGAGDVTESSAPMGVDAATAWAAPVVNDLEVLDQFHAELVAPSHPGRTLGWDVNVDVGDPVDPRRVDELAIDATRRAWAMLVHGLPSGLRASALGDIARVAAAATHATELSNLSTRTRLSTTALKAWAEAWRIGGDEAVAVIADEDTWLIDQDRLAAGRETLVELGIPKRSVALNYDSLGMPRGIKLVIGEDGRWYQIHSKPGVRGSRDQLHISRPPSFDIADVVDRPEA